MYERALVATCAAGKRKRTQLQGKAAPLVRWMSPRLLRNNTISSVSCRQRESSKRFESQDGGSKRYNKYKLTAATTRCLVAKVS